MMRARGDSETMLTQKRLEKLDARLREDREAIGQPILGPNGEKILSWSDVDALIVAARAGVAARAWFPKYANVWADGWDGIHPLRCAVGAWTDGLKRDARPTCTCGLDNLLVLLGVRTTPTGRGSTPEEKA